MKSTEIIYELISQRGLTAAQVSKDTGISTALLTQWKQGLQQPSPKSLAVLADYFHVSVDYLLGKDQPQAEPAAQDPQITILSRAAKNMTEEQKNKLVELARMLYPEAFNK